MGSGSFQFESFTLDPANRVLQRDGEPVELSPRYFDALLLLVQERGKLVSKDRFLADVWRGVPVTDEALTQCIRMLRRQLGDDAASPRFIQTVPKHGYRFVAPVSLHDGPAPSSATAAPEPAGDHRWREFFALGAAGTLGASVAGVVGGLFYGVVAAAQPLDGGPGGASVLLVLMWLTIVAALVGGAGVSFGIAATGFPALRGARIAGGGLGGMVVGGAVKLLGLDAFNLLLGRSPHDITGGMEGLLLGAAVGLGAWLADRRATSTPLRHRVALAALTAGLGAMLVPLLGGRLMGGSLDLLAHTFPGSRLNLDSLGRPFGEAGFGPLAQLATAGLEGALFGGCIVGAMGLARRSLKP